MHLLDVVALVSSRPADGLRAGSVGTIVDVHEGSPAAYEVEFTDDDGGTVALLTLGPAEIRPWRG